MNPIRFPEAPANGVFLGPGTGPGPGTTFTIPPAKMLTGDYVLTEADVLSILYCVSAIPMTITIPVGLRPAGWVTVVQSGVGRVTILPGAGLQLDVVAGRVAGTNAQDTSVTLHKLTDTRWQSGGVAAPPSASPRAYWGMATTPSLNEATILAQGTVLEIAGLPATVTYDNTGGRYPFFAHPAAWGATNRAMIGAFLYTDLDITEISLPDGLGASVPYRVLRFRGIQHGSNQTVTW